jgi:hypothetical protein
MINLKELNGPTIMTPEGMVVAMAVEFEGKTFYMQARVKDGRWISHIPDYRLPPKLLGWTGLDESWGHRNE